MARYREQWALSIRHRSSGERALYHQGFDIVGRLQRELNAPQAPVASTQHVLLAHLCVQALLLEVIRHPHRLEAI